MNKIKGLLLKDLAQLRGYRKNIIIMLVLYLLAMIPGAMEEGLDVTSQSMIILVFGIIGITTFNYDESSKTDRYLLTMPLTKNEIVLEKYILSVVTTIIGAIITFLVSITINFIISKNFSSLLPLTLSVAGGFLGVSVLVSFQIPCIYRWGAERGRIQAMILMAISVGILTAASVLLGNNIMSHIGNDATSSMIFHLLPVICIVVALIVYWVSYHISLKQFHKREV